jgi:hypothetical protein
MMKVAGLIANVSAQKIDAPAQAAVAVTRQKAVANKRRIIILVPLITLVSVALSTPASDAAASDRLTSGACFEQR